MAEALYLLSKTVSPGDMVVDDIVHMLTNDDDGQTAAQTIATACGLLRTAGRAIEGSTYFDTRTLLATGSGALGTDGDYILLLPRDKVTVTA